MDIRKWMLPFLILATILFVGFTTFCAASLVVLNHLPPGIELEQRVPDPSQGPDAVYTPIDPVLTEGPGTPSKTITGSWARFRGSDFDGIRNDAVTLAETWPDQGPPVLWSQDLGEGYAGAAIRHGCAYVLDYDQEKKRDTLRCLSMDDGREVWNLSYEVVIKRFHGMSRTIPAVTEQYCLTLGPKCHVMCADAVTGRLHWSLDLVHTYGTEVPQWYAGQCPLIDELDGREVAVLAPAGPEALMVALDGETGEEVWRTPNPFFWKMTHSSIMPMDLDGRPTYVYCGKGGVVGVDAATGEILWSSEDWKISIATSPSPLVLPENRIFFCGSYNSGALMMQIQGSAGDYSAKTLYELEPSQFGSTQQTPIFYDHHIFGIRERDKQFVCLDLEGNEVWSSGTQQRFGSGPYLIADGKIYILDDFATLTMAEATVEGYHPLDQATMLEGHDAWAPMALVQGRLILRDLTTMLCVDLRPQ